MKLQTREYFKRITLSESGGLTHFYLEQTDFYSLIYLSYLNIFLNNFNKQISSNIKIIFKEILYNILIGKMITK